MKDIIPISIFFIAILSAGTTGYMMFEDFGFWNSVYLTAMTITTVGYGDIVPVHPYGKVFTVLLAFTGVGFVLYAFSRLAETMIEGGLRNILERRKMNKQVAQLKKHYIVCGYGRIGKVICQILKDNKRPFVVIEKDEEEIRRANLDARRVTAVAHRFGIRRRDAAPSSPELDPHWLSSVAVAVARHRRVYKKSA